MMIATTHSVKHNTTRNSAFDIDDIYDISKKRFDKDMYVDVMKSYFKYALDYMLEGNDLKLGYRLGYLKIRKEKVDIIIRDNGKIITNCYVDIPATKKLKNNADPFEPLKIVKHVDMDYVVRAKWDKGIFNNVRTYYYKPSSKLSKIMFDRAVNNDISEFNELHKNKEFNRKDKQGQTR